MTLTFLDPRQASSAMAVTPAARLTSLAGRRLGLLWNNRLGGEELLRRIGALLHAKHRLGEIYFTKKTFIGNPAPPEVVADLVARVDAVVVGVGD